MTSIPSYDPQGIIKNIDRRDDIVILFLTGEIDMSHSTDLRGELLEILQQPPPAIVINMDEVTFMDSSGVAVLVEALQLCRGKKSQLRLVALQPRVRSIFEISQLDTVFDIYDTQQEALAQ